MRRGRLWRRRSALFFTPRRRPGSSSEGRAVAAAYVYIMANRRNGAVYIGVTTELAKRAWEHRHGVMSGFTRKYRCHTLVWYEPHETLESARLREQRMKEWKRAWKLREIEGLNPDWADLADVIAHA